MTRLNGIIVSKIPNPTPERQVTLVTREGEWQLIAELLAAETRRLLIEKFLPQLIAEMPFLKTEITVAAQ
jgi:hypothetical protein